MSHFYYKINSNCVHYYLLFFYVLIKYFVFLYFFVLEEFWIRLLKTIHSKLNVECIIYAISIFEKYVKAKLINFFQMSLKNKTLDIYQCISHILSFSFYQKSENKFNIIKVTINNKYMFFL